MTPFTTKYLDEQQAKGKIRGYTSTTQEIRAVQKGKSKMGNVKVELDGYTFDSKKECRRYVELRMLQTIGEIKDLRLQVPYELNEGGSHSLKYVADFEYIRNGVKVTEDAKGYKTVTYKKKRKLMLSVHGITILET